MNKAKNILLSLSLIVGLSAGLVPAVASAQSNGLGITPRKDYTVKPGQKISDTLYINDLSKTQDLQVSLKIVDFKAQGETGTPALVLGANPPQTTWSLKPFINLPKSVTVKVGNSVQVPLTIAIPAGQGAGSYYSAVEYVATGGNNQQNVNIVASTASLIFVTVPGKATENMTLDRFGAFIPTADDQSGNFSSLFFTSAPKVLAYVLNNQGNVAENPSGSILIKNMTGRQIRQIDQSNPQGNLALIGQTRRFEVCIVGSQQTLTDSSGQKNTQTVCQNPKLSPGRYTAELTVLYGLNGNPTQQIVATTTFWYLPIWFDIIVIIVLAIIALVIYLIVHKTHQHISKRVRRR